MRKPELLRWLRRAGCEVGFTKKNHIRVRTPSGAIVTTAGTPSDCRSWKNFQARLKQHGVVLCTTT